MTRKCPAVIHLAGGREPLHEPGGPAHRSDRQAAADDLAEDRQIRVHTEEPLRTAIADPKPRDHLIKDQQRAMVRGQFPHPCEVLGVRHDHAHVRGHRLHDHGRDVMAVALHQRGEGPAIVIGNADRLLLQRLHEPGRLARHEALAVAVIAAVEHHDAAAARVGARELDGGQARLGPGGREAHLLDGGHRIGDQAGQLDFAGMRQPHEDPVGHRLLERAHHLRRVVAQDQRPPAHDEIDESLAAGAHDLGSLPLDKHQRFGVDLAKRAHRAVHPAHQIPPRILSDSR